MPTSIKHNRTFCVACGETSKCNQLNNELMFAMMADRMFEYQTIERKGGVLEHLPLCVCKEEKRRHYYIVYDESGLGRVRLWPQAKFSENTSAVAEFMSSPMLSVLI